MTKKNPFDDLAEQYDSLFTRSNTGVAQRKIVWRFLQRRIFPSIEILEVNCGTGEDAYYLSELGCRITATDASAGMIRQCMDKRQTFPGHIVPVFKQASINELGSVIGEKKFDLIFSNFSGLNCLDQDELCETVAKFHSFLKPDGSMIFVVFGTKCLWEKLYFLLKGRKEEMNRRSRNRPVYAQLLKSGIQIHYYSPVEIQELFGNYFKVAKIKPVGLFIPPTYLDRFFEHRKFFFWILKCADRLAEPFSFLADLADHYIIELKKV